MSEEDLVVDQNAEDSTGATEADIVTTQDEDVKTVEAGADDQEVEYYQIGDMELTLDEAKEWKAAYEKKRDTDKAWTQKTQSLSDERKAFEQERDSFSDKLEMLGSMESDIKGLMLGEYAEIDLDKVLEEQGTDEYLRVQREIEKRSKGFEGISKKYADMQNKYYSEAYKELSDSLGWSDEAKKAEDLKTIGSYVKDVGITEREFNKVTNPKIMSALLEAAKYRELKKKTSTTEKKVTQAPKISKPSQKATAKPKTMAQRMYPNM